MDEQAVTPPRRSIRAFVFTYFSTPIWIRVCVLQGYGCIAVFLTFFISPAEQAAGCDCRRGRAGKCQAETHRAHRSWPGRSPAIADRRRFEWSKSARQHRRFQCSFSIRDNEECIGSGSPELAKIVPGIAPEAEADRLGVREFSGKGALRQRYDLRRKLRLSPVPSWHRDEVE